MSSTAFAATLPEDAGKSLDAIAACRSIAVDRERLACYDKGAAVIVSWRQSGQLMVFDRKQVEADRRRQFGLTDPPAGTGERAAADAVSVKTLTSRVTEVTQGAGPNRWTMTLDNGQVWQMLGTATVEPRRGAAIRLTTTVTGGIRAAIDGRAPVQVRRVR